MDKVRVYGEELGRFTENNVNYVVLEYEDWVGNTVVGIGAEFFEIKEV